MAAHGATLVPGFDKERVTHIIVQEGVKELRQLLARAKVKDVEEIPERIPILRWEWVDESWKKRAFQPIHQFPAFKTRITFPPDYVPPTSSADAERPLPPSRQASTSRARSTSARKSDPEDSNGSGDEKIRYVPFT